MKKLSAAALVLTLFSSYIVPEEKPAPNDCRLFRDTEFAFSCTDTECNTIKATGNGITFTGDAEGMKVLQTPEGKEMMDQMLGQLLVECIKGNVHSITPAEIAEGSAKEK